MKNESGIGNKKKTIVGFTLIELLVVIAIIGLLASIITTSLSNARVKARDTKRVSDINQIRLGMDVYFSFADAYPPASQFVAASTISCGAEQVLRVPVDPLAPTYNYVYSVTGANMTGCSGQTDLRPNYTVSFTLEKTGVLYTMNQDGTVTPPLPDL
ncbi:MAG: hypothetical protein COT91_00515 [Candidatus Doudnabacteria bacterium CG10_big_fil_rev_8_21_14_0_10_41_10]|uniref:Type II secretion system protein GspG C-terminal domain-containing protein n=1 Tax=Candidatus Doudnabacteria bacterium CG10_big_fil_rev_8_21_14_0_10_41_10 TaxID=1974551 RepID=A0A2H0VEW3_9BACT|nr:MAG: hypothetical protein COT91_00515 [Candidatus Doudnabacteria bacterium CG10_big_fil_rev_8_21_14_0_10_41_10]